ncbi:AAA family ATPase [Pseudomonas syringae]|uniref:AAA family ATPase n=1 Tax=Pseudomonas syringae TaxID=317 RepID=UPI00040CADCE|nr:AAA family ATPase [Pseudomonas syringae]MDY2564786.1 AAA family ATPase [Pseudomonas syringae]
MKFYFEIAPPFTGEPFCLIVGDSWNDWFKWHTMFKASIVVGANQSVTLGFVKIARRGMIETAGITVLPPFFDDLGGEFFSLGQDENYYETLVSLGDSIRESYLKGIRDSAFNLNILAEHEGEPVFRESLLRDVDVNRVKERFSFLAKAEMVLTPYSFEYAFPEDPIAITPAPILKFEVVPRSLPSTNTHVIIGRNGVGKSRCFDMLARSFLDIPNEDPDSPSGQLRSRKFSPIPFSSNARSLGFAGLVAVSFSAFDSKGPLGGKVSGNTLPYQYIGLITREPLPGSPINSPPLPEPRVKGSSELAVEFANSVLVCLDGVRRDRWRTALSTLESDPLFAEINVSQLSEEPKEEIEAAAKRLYKNLSSGHAIVILAITRLVELIEEKSLVLIDEPECHLHPPLLSAFIRALNDLLVNRNGVGVIATHSPVVLQEVPASCVWKLSRSGHEVSAERPEIKTFGENVGVLTREVFNLELTQTGYHKIISQKAIGLTYEQIVAEFDGELGAEGRALARALSLISDTDV